jgi:hypothetical protein
MAGDTGISDELDPSSDEALAQVRCLIEESR